MNFVEELTSSTLSERDILVAEYIAAKRRLISPIAPQKYWHPQKVAPSAQTTPESATTAQTTPEDAITKSEAFQPKQQKKLKWTSPTGRSTQEYFIDTMQNLGHWMWTQPVTFKARMSSSPRIGPLKMT